MFALSSKIAEVGQVGSQKMGHIGFLAQHKNTISVMVRPFFLSSSLVAAADTAADTAVATTLSDNVV